MQFQTVIYSSGLLFCTAAIALYAGGDPKGLSLISGVRGGQSSQTARSQYKMPRNHFKKALHTPLTALEIAIHVFNKNQWFEVTTYWLKYSIHKNMWQYLHSTLCTKNACSRTYISDGRIGQISSGYSSLWVSPWICLHSASAVLLPTYEYGLHTHLPLWFPLHRIARIFAAISFLLPLYIFRIWFACDISARTRYGIDTATSYVLNYLCLSLDLLFYLCCDCQSLQLYYRSFFLSIALSSLSTRSASGFL